MRPDLFVLILVLGLVSGDQRSFLINSNLEPFEFSSNKSLEILKCFKSREVQHLQTVWTLKTVEIRERKMFVYSSRQIVSSAVQFCTAVTGL